MVERVCWVLMGIVLAAALCGVLAAGPLSKAVASDEGGFVRVEYERFQRNLTSTMLRISLSSQATTGRTAGIRMRGGIVSDMRIENIMPLPAEARATGDGIDFVFHVADPGKPATVRFYLQPHTVGSVTGEVGLAGREPARLHSFVYP